MGKQYSKDSTTKVQAGKPVYVLPQNTLRLCREHKRRIVSCVQIIEEVIEPASVFQIYIDLNTVKLTYEGKLLWKNYDYHLSDDHSLDINAAVSPQIMQLFDSEIDNIMNIRDIQEKIYRTLALLDVMEDEAFYLIFIYYPTKLESLLKKT